MKLEKFKNKLLFTSSLLFMCSSPLFAQFHNNSITNNQININSLEKKFDYGEYLKDFNYFSIEDYKRYLINDLDDSNKARIDFILNNFIEKNKNSLFSNILTKNINDINNEEILNVEKDIIKSVILYHLTSLKKNLFNHIKDDELSIKKMISILTAISKLETGSKSLNFDHREFSSTKAYGRFQMLASTYGPIVYRIYIENDINFNKIVLPIKNDHKTQLLSYIQEINSFSNIYEKERWDSKSISQKYSDFYIYLRRLNDSILKSVNNHNKNIANKDGVGIETITKKLFYTKNKIDEKKQFIFSLKLLEFIKEPVNQGILSLAILDEMSERIVKRDKRLTLNNELLISKLLESYNGDTNLGKNNLPIKKNYAKKGLNLYLKTLNNLEEELPIKTNIQSTKNIKLSTLSKKENNTGKMLTQGFFVQKYRGD